MQLHSSLLHQNYEDFFLVQLTYCERIFSTENTLIEALLHSSYLKSFCLTILETSIYIWQFLNKSLLMFKQKMTHQLTLKMFEGFTFIIFP